jgi:hypothetical protein
MHLIVASALKLNYNYFMNKYLYYVEYPNLANVALNNADTKSVIGDGRNDSEKWVPSVGCGSY